jgi:hypothetical protein
MTEKKETSKFAANMKTIAFFAIILGIFFGTVIFFGTPQTAEKPKVSEGYKSVDISTLSDFDYYTPRVGEKTDEKRMAENKIPEKIKQLNGQKVALTGFMMPVRVDDAGMVEEFALNGNYDMCFYGAPSSLNQWVHVKMQGGAKAKFSHSPTTVSGTLEVGELVQDGEVISLYRLNGHKASAQTRRAF